MLLPPTSDWKTALHRSGCDVLDRVIDEHAREALGAAFDGVRTGYRRGLELPVVRELAASAPLQRLATAALGPTAFPVRATLFDKSPLANWLVAWHQDLTIPVRERVPAPGYSAWSRKDGVWHVRPPTGVLAAMLAIRVDLDGSDADSGALRVLPGSHRAGILEPEAITRLRESTTPRLCVVPAGGALLMRPLLVHSSSKSVRATRRRVVHLEVAAETLPGGVHWHI